MSGPFAGLRVVDATHVLAGPFAAYQLGLLGAEVVKVEHAGDPDQSRDSGPDAALCAAGMGTYFLTQASNKRSLTLDLKQEAGRAVLRRLLATADVFVENYRPGAFAALGLGYAEVVRDNPRLIYCSMSAFGQQGPRGGQTAYDHVIQATSGLMHATGTEEGGPTRLGAPAVDYCTGAIAAFALATALYNRERTGRGCHLDLAMLDVALLMQASHIPATSRGRPPRRHGNRHEHATSSCYPTADGLLMLGASNLRQQRRLWAALGRPEMAKDSNPARYADRDREAALLTELLAARPAAAWEDHLQAHHVPAARVRSLPEALADPQLASRAVLHRHEAVPGAEGGVTVPLTAFTLDGAGGTVTGPPPRLGEHTDAVLAELGYSASEVAALRDGGIV